MDRIRSELMRHRSSLAALGVFAWLTACTPDVAERRSVASAGVVDSAFPVEEQLRRFRGTIADTATTLRGGAGTREALVAQLVGSLGRADTAGAMALVLSPSEFAWLYFPASRLARAPYALPPALAWFQIGGNTRADLHRALAMIHGTEARYVSHGCDSLRAEEANRIHESCRVRVQRRGGDVQDVVLFGSIVERDGRFKFVGLANRM